jgi:polysaccharide biosynthesis/export protein
MVIDAKKNEQDNSVTKAKQQTYTGNLIEYPMTERQFFRNMGNENHCFNKGYSVKKIPTAHTNIVKLLIISLFLIGIGGLSTGCAPTNKTVKESLGTISRGDSLHLQSSNLQSPTYIFRTGDQLRITIRGFSEFDTTVFVSETGTIAMRYVGELRAANLSRTQLTEEIISKLSFYIKTEIIPSIAVLNTITQKVAVLGAVGKQDNYAISSDVTILQILAMAGGATTDADLEHTKIFRAENQQVAEEVDLNKYIAKGDIKEIPMVRPGDIVYIPREENIIRELSTFFRDAIFLFTLFTISN